MSKIMLKSLCSALDITSTGIKTAVALTKTPFLGGQGRSGVLVQDVKVGGAGSIAIQGHNSVDNVAPASGDAGWFTIVTLNSGTKLSQEIELPRFIRPNVLVAGTGTLTIDIDGIQ